MGSGPEHRSILHDKAISRLDDPRKIRNKRLRKKLAGALLLPSISIPAGTAVLIAYSEPATVSASVTTPDVAPPVSVTVKPDISATPVNSKSPETAKTTNADNTSRVVTGDIPADYLALYRREASTCAGLSWALLAAVGKVESDHGRHPLTNQPTSKGAIGPMQFLPSTWAQYGEDGNHDGVKNILNPADAIKGAASYLCASGIRAPQAVKNDRCPDLKEPPALEEALWRYNKACSYVDDVLRKKTLYETQGSTKS